MENEKDSFNFEDLFVYKKAVDLTSEVYDACKQFPPIEKFALADQFRRAATSIALNIAEGSGGSRLEFIKFLRIARRSIRECIAIITISRNKEYLNVDQECKLRMKLIEISKMISGLMGSLSRS